MSEIADAANGLIDLENDKLVPVNELCKLRLGRRMAPATIGRWCRKGTRAGKLEAVHICGCWHTTVAAFADFIRRQTAAALRRNAAPDANDEELRDAGLLDDPRQSNNL